MGTRGVQKLTDSQQRALDIVTEVSNTAKTAHKVVYARIKREVEKEMAAYDARVESAVVEAVNLGVPKSRIAREGLGTTSTNRIYDMIKSSQGDSELVMPPLSSAVARFSWGLVERNGAGVIAWLHDGDLTEQVAYDADGISGSGWPFVHGKSTGWFRLFAEGMPKAAEAWAWDNLPNVEE